MQVFCADFLVKPMHFREYTVFDEHLLPKHRLTWGSTLRMPSKLGLEMSFVDMSNDFPGASLVGKHHKQVFENRDNLKVENHPNQ